MYGTSSAWFNKTPKQTHNYKTEVTVIPKGVFVQKHGLFTKMTFTVALFP